MTLKLGMVIGGRRMDDMLMLVSMNLTLTHGHSGSAKAKQSALNYLDNEAS